VSYRIQEPPFSIQWESTEGCTLRCSFCGLNSIRTNERTYSYMTIKTATRIAKEIARMGWKSRLELAMHGETTKNPQVLELISIFRKYLPDNFMLMETNGGGFLGKSPEEITQKVLAYFFAGLDTIGLDEYQTVPWANIVRTKIIRTVLEDNQIKFHEYPSDPEGNPHSRSKKKRLVIISPIDLADHGTHSELNNHAGGGAPLDTSMIHERCAKPFRELSIRWDGNVALCCNDWVGAYKIGNVLQTPINKIWNHPRFYAARQKLLHKQRDFTPCLGCNNRSYRVGLLPDKFGRETLPLPDAKTEKILKEAVDKGPLASPVDRGWNTDRSLVQIVPSRHLL
jgi:radical SAM protein with 4Fe4S-binding SPASM domain